MSTPDTQRRRFLVGSAAFLAGGAVACSLGDWVRSSTPFENADAARRIGARYADDYPDAQSEAGLWRGRPPESLDDWGPRLKALRREDFEADRMVRVDGWWVAETELRVCVFLHAATLPEAARGATASS